MNSDTTQWWFSPTMAPYGPSGLQWTNSTPSIVMLVMTQSWMNPNVKICQKFPSVFGQHVLTCNFCALLKPGVCAQLLLHTGPYFGDALGLGLLSYTWFTLGFLPSKSILKPTSRTSLEGGYKVLLSN
jgi:hypothetical protein